MRVLLSSILLGLFTLSVSGQNDSDQPEASLRRGFTRVDALRTNIVIGASQAFSSLPSAVTAAVPNINGVTFTATWIAGDRITVNDATQFYLHNGSKWTPSPIGVADEEIWLNAFNRINFTGTGVKATDAGDGRVDVSIEPVSATSTTIYNVTNIEEIFETTWKHMGGTRIQELIATTRNGSLIEGATRFESDSHIKKSDIELIFSVDSDLHSKIHKADFVVWGTNEVYIFKPLPLANPYTGESWPVDVYLTYELYDYFEEQ